MGRYYGFDLRVADAHRFLGYGYFTTPYWLVLITIPRAKYCIRLETHFTRSLPGLWAEA